MTTKKVDGKIGDNLNYIINFASYLHIHLRNEYKLVCAESCTCGLIASVFGAVPGVSDFFCGSAVVYRTKTKSEWLGVKKKTIKKYTTESPEMAFDICCRVLKKTPEANIGLSIVGDLGPNCELEKDGLIHVCFLTKYLSGNLEGYTYSVPLESEGRIERQREAALYALEVLKENLI